MHTKQGLYQVCKSTQSPILLELWIEQTWPQPGLQVWNTPITDLGQIYENSRISAEAKFQYSPTPNSDTLRQTDGDADRDRQRERERESD